MILRSKTRSKSSKKGTKKPKLPDPNARKELVDFDSFEKAVSAIRKAKNIVVVAGAGISVSCGIPDFRTKDKGIYDTLDCKSLGIPSSELLFDLEFFKIDPSPFYKFAKNLIPKKVSPSHTHQFIHLLEKKGKLLRSYTQNIDGIERSMGMTKIVECHGTVREFQCLKASCKRKKGADELQEEITAGTVCYCTCGDVLKPCITFFGEFVPMSFNTALQNDYIKCDLLLVMGTSLKTGGAVHELLKNIHPSVPQILINKTEVQPPSSISCGFDVSLIGECDDVVSCLLERLNWKTSPKPTKKKKQESTMPDGNIGASSDKIKSRRKPVSKYVCFRQSPSSRTFTVSRRLPKPRARKSATKETATMQQQES